MFWSTRKTELELQYENVSIHPTAEIADDVEIGPFSVIGANCRLASGCRLHNSVTLARNTVLGERTEVFPGAVIGAAPQDKKYDGEDSWVIIGRDNQIRECVTIHAGTEFGGRITRVGHRNLLMAGSHIAHDCVVEDDVILANGVLLGGHVHVASFANLGGLAAVHHFVSIGRHSFVAGATRVHRDVPPFMLWENGVRTINKVGLRRRQFSEDILRALKCAYRLVYRARVPRKEVIPRVEAELGACPREVNEFIEFLERADRGHQGRALQPYNVSL